MKAQGFARTLMAAAIGLSICSTAIAQGAVDSGLTISVGGAYNMLDTVRNVDDSFAPEVGLGYRFNDRFSVEGNYSMYSTDHKVTGSSWDMDEYRLDAYFDLMPWDGSWTPYIVAGASMLDMSTDNESHDDNRVNAGFGLRKALTPNLSVRGDVRAIRSVDDNQTEGSANLGLTWTFGSVAEPMMEEPVAVVEEEVVVVEEPVILDGDMDGIADADDLCLSTPAGVTVDAKGCEELDTLVLFDFDSADLRAEDLATITQTGEFLQRNSTLNIKITGYTDSTGTDEYNQELSLERAEAVRQALTEEFGIDASRMELEGMGKADPVATNQTLEGREDNRRAVMISVIPQA